MDHARILNFLNSLQNQACTQQTDNAQCSKESLKSLYEKFTKDYSLQRARTLSREERLANHLTSNSLSYGEIEFTSLSVVFQQVSPKKGGIFYDLGSGIGKSVIAASLMHQFDICKGIELLHSLHEQACKLKQEVENRNHLLKRKWNRLEQQTINNQKLNLLMEISKNQIGVMAPFYLLQLLVSNQIQ